MVTGNQLGIAPFAPVSNVTPFTYRDGETFLTQLHRLRCFVEEMLIILEKADEDNRDYVNKAIQDLINQFNTALAKMQEEIDGLSAGAEAFNPTNGFFENLSKVVNDTYDNTRVFAYFAKELDALDMNVTTYDQFMGTARHFDLGITYPVIHDDLES